MDARAVAAYLEHTRPGLIAKHRVASALVERGDEPENLTPAEIAPALAVEYAGLLRVVDKEVVAVSVHAEVPHERTRIRAHAAYLVTPRILRAGCPGLVAVDEDFLVLRRVQLQNRLGGDYYILRQQRREPPRA